MADEKKLEFKTGELLVFVDVSEDFLLAEVAGCCGVGDVGVVLMVGTHNQTYSKDYLRGEGCARKVRLADVITLVNRTAQQAIRTP